MTRSSMRLWLIGWCGLALAALSLSWREAMQSPLWNDGMVASEADLFFEQMEAQATRIMAALNEISEETEFRDLITALERNHELRWRLQALGRMRLLSPLRKRELQVQLIGRLVAGSGRALAWRILSPLLSESTITASLLPMASSWPSWSMAMVAAIVGGGEVRGGTATFHEPGQQLLAMLRASDGVLGRAGSMLETADGTLLLNWLSIFRYDLTQIERHLPGWGKQMAARLAQLQWLDDPCWYLIAQIVRLNGHDLADNLLFDTGDWGHLSHDDSDEEDALLDWWLRWAQEHSVLLIGHAPELSELTAPMLRLLEGLVQRGGLEAPHFALPWKWLLCFVMRQQVTMPADPILRNQLAPLLHLAATHHRLPLRCGQIEAIWTRLLLLVFKGRGDGRLLRLLSGWMEEEAREYGQDSTLVRLLYHVLLELGEAQLDRWSPAFVRAWLGGRFPIPVGLRRLLQQRYS